MADEERSGPLGFGLLDFDPEETLPVALGIIRTATSDQVKNTVVKGTSDAAQQMGDATDSLNQAHRDIEGILRRVDRLTEDLKEELPFSLQTRLRKHARQLRTRRSDLIQQRQALRNDAREIRERLDEADF